MAEVLAAAASEPESDTRGLYFAIILSTSDELVDDEVVGADNEVV